MANLFLYSLLALRQKYGTVGGKFMKTSVRSIPFMQMYTSVYIYNRGKSVIYRQSVQLGKIYN